MRLDCSTENTIADSRDKTIVQQSNRHKWLHERRPRTQKVVHKLIYNNNNNSNIKNNNSSSSSNSNNNSNNNNDNNYRVKINY